jgi:hypothetical protein
MREWFDNAPRYHAGGMVGLTPNEIPAILQRGEEVLARSNARNAANGGNQSSSQHIQVISGLIRANKGAVRTALA